MNFNFQIQPLKSQIINMRFQIDNIELQMNNNSLYPMNIENFTKFFIPAHFVNIK